MNIYDFYTEINRENIEDRLVCYFSQGLLFNIKGIKKTHQESLWFDFQKNPMIQKDIIDKYYDILNNM